MVAGKLEDVDYDELDLRPSELAIKIKEKRGAYAVPKVFFFFITPKPRVE